MIWASEGIRWASSLCAMNRILVRIITAVIVTITKPVRFNANVGLFTLEMIRGARHVHWTSLMRLVRSRVVFTVVDSVADLRLRNAAPVQACKFPVGTGRIFAVELI